MTRSSASTILGGAADQTATEKADSVHTARRRSSPAARRRLLVLCGLLLLVVVAVLANIGPATHYGEARARLDKATTKVDALETQKAALQAQVAKLGETRYLETLARQQLTYVRPGEELYIVTPSPGETPAGPAVAPASTGSGAGTAAVSDRDLGIADGATPTTPSDLASLPGNADGSADGTSSSPNDTPGFLERVVSAIRSLF